MRLSIRNLKQRFLGLLKRHPKFWTSFRLVRWWLSYIMIHSWACQLSSWSSWYRNVLNQSYRMLIDSKTSKLVLILIREQAIKDLHHRVEDCTTPLHSEHYWVVYSYTLILSLQALSTGARVYWGLWATRTSFISASISHCYSSFRVLLSDLSGTARLRLHHTACSLLMSGHSRDGRRIAVTLSVPRKKGRYVKSSKIGKPYAAGR